MACRGAPPAGGACRGTAAADAWVKVELGDGAKLRGKTDARGAANIDLSGVAPNHYNMTRPAVVRVESRTIAEVDLKDTEPYARWQFIVDDTRKERAAAEIKEKEKEEARAAAKAEKAEREKAEAEALRQQRAECDDQKKADACLAVAVAADRDMEIRRLAEPYYKRACSLGSQPACARAAELDVERQKEQAQDRRARAAAERRADADAATAGDSCESSCYEKTTACTKQCEASFSFLPARNRCLQSCYQRTVDCKSDCKTRGAFGGR